MTIAASSSPCLVLAEQRIWGEISTEAPGGTGHRPMPLEILPAQLVKRENLLSTKSICRMSVTPRCFVKNSTDFGPSFTRNMVWDRLRYVGQSILFLSKLDPIAIWVESECQTLHDTLVWLLLEIDPLGQKLLGGCVHIVAIESDVAETTVSWVLRVIVTLASLPVLPFPP